MPRPHPLPTLRHFVVRPVDRPVTVPGKWFASGYALYCGLVVLVAWGLLLVPVAQRVLHRLHLDLDHGP